MYGLDVALHGFSLVGNLIAVFVIYILIAVCGDFGAEFNRGVYYGHDALFARFYMYRQLFFGRVDFVAGLVIAILIVDEHYALTDLEVGMQLVGIIFAARTTRLDGDRHRT